MEYALKVIRESLSVGGVAMPFSCACVKEAVRGGGVVARRLRSATTPDSSPASAP